VICRVIDPPREPFPFDGGEYLIGRPSRRAEDEAALLSGLGVDVVVTKNSGGPGRGKLDAARSLGIAVVMIARPPMPAAERVATPEEALDWIRAL
jgi:precorrin-6A/cobalt-precorrin-6A reductase